MQRCQYKDCLSWQLTIVTLTWQLAVKNANSTMQSLLFSTFEANCIVVIGNTKGTVNSIICYCIQWQHNSTRLCQLFLWMLSKKQNQCWLALFNATNHQIHNLSNIWPICLSTELFHYIAHRECLYELNGNAAL